ncbi:MAG: 3'-5' exonuclease [Planctomycetes bacterium]|nr:3'-5' exonuclease [Planctomycetota bacterium]
MATGIASHPILKTPVAVLDFETTGLTAGADRVIEVSVVRVDPGQEPRLVLDTLVNPHRHVAATEIHGITDADVKNAPTFPEIAGDLLGVLEGCVVAAYNVYFDIKFLNFEMANAGIEHEPPHFCLMYMRPLLGLGSRCKLQEACRQHGIDFDDAHVAAEDAMASGRLLQCYLDELRRRKIRTYDDLTRLRSYKFLKSFANDPFPSASTFNLPGCDRLLSRIGHVQETVVDPRRKAVREYWDTLKTVVADLEITDEELRYVVAQRKRLGLAKEHVRVLHARAFASAIAQFCDDERLDDKEVMKLRRLHQCLSTLGWAPGQ